MPRRKVQPGLLSPADAADLSARLDWLEQRAIVAATGGLILTEGPGGTVVRQPAVTPAPGGGMAPYSGCSLWRTSHYSVANNAMTDYPWTSGDNYTDRYWDVASPAAITTPREGMYLLTADVIWEANGNGDRWAEVYDNFAGVYLAGAGGKPNAINGVTGTGLSFSVVFFSLANATYKLRVYQSSGGAISVIGATTGGYTKLQVVRLNDAVSPLT